MGNFCRKSKNGLLPLESDPYSTFSRAGDLVLPVPDDRTDKGDFKFSSENSKLDAMIPASAIRDTIAPATFFIFILLAIFFCSSREGEGGGVMGEEEVASQITLASHRKVLENL